jgi:hypothetical protein
MASVVVLSCACAQFQDKNSFMPLTPKMFLLGALCRLLHARNSPMPLALTSHPPLAPVPPPLQELQGTPPGTSVLAELDHHAGVDAFLRGIGYDGRCGKEGAGGEGGGRSPFDGVSSVPERRILAKRERLHKIFTASSHPLHSGPSFRRRARLSGVSAMGLQAEARLRHSGRQGQLLFFAGGVRFLLSSSNPPPRPSPPVYF